MNNFAIHFDSLISFWWTGVLAGVAAIILAAIIYSRGRQNIAATILRVLTCILFFVCLLNPKFTWETYESHKTVVALISDASNSQQLDGRQQQTNLISEQIENQLKQFPQFEIKRATNSSDSETNLFNTLQQTLRDIVPSRFGGAILITDGQVHDVPSELNFSPPLHAIITGSKADRDRRIVLEQAPKFGIVGEMQKIIYKVADANINESAEVQISIDGKHRHTQNVRPGESAEFQFKLEHGGKTIIEISTAKLAGELTDINNKVFVELNGVRENLRVLLISGSPHAGERAWRNLLKSDASVDLVHFTILRPVHKEDGTPVDELSLIAFPIRELFIEKIDEFDLIIFDRYKRHNILPLLYFDSITQYVKNGGAILMAVGSEHAKEQSMQTSPLARIFPVRPSGNILQQPFVPRVSKLGERHPVTRRLHSGESPNWSRWFRHIENEKLSGDSIMEGPGKNPLLVLDRKGEGRIAMLMSDHVWLWARGFQGGGPHVLLLRRLAHWLMQEPTLEEESVGMEISGEQIILTRQSMKDEINNGELIAPDGARHKIELTKASDGIWQGEFSGEQHGLYRFEADGLQALAARGSANQIEYQEIVSTKEKLEGVASVARADRGGGVVRVPNIVPLLESSSILSGDGWLGVLDRRARTLVGLTQFSIFSTWAGLITMLLMLCAMWWCDHSGVVRPLRCGASILNGSEKKLIVTRR